MYLRIFLKVCEGCGVLWFRAQGCAEVYCPGCARKTAGSAAGATIAPAGAPRTPQKSTARNGEHGMSAVPAMPCIVATATAVAESVSRARPKPIVGFAFYRKHTLALLHRYLRISLEIGRAPSALGRIVLRGRVSSYRLRTFEDGMIFVLDMEKA